MSESDTKKRIELFREFFLCLPENIGGSCCTKPKAKEHKKSEILARHLDRFSWNYKVKWDEGNVLKGNNHPLWELRLKTGFIPAESITFSGGCFKKVFFSHSSMDCCWLDAMIAVKNNMIMLI